ncbi:hypothetical protein CRG98_024103 [Punica granatum]|uniref:Uncharacterized protein n=1 Tax=Punica granatum TaxID=22663 RepID=A0A2I0JGV7_PUNGR|nr:hypothetical protein CRG98_024103 [Punica granatum]
MKTWNQFLILVSKGVCDELKMIWKHVYRSRLRKKGVIYNGVAEVNQQERSERTIWKQWIARGRDFDEMQKMGVMSLTREIVHRHLQKHGTDRKKQRHSSERQNGHPGPISWSSPGQYAYLMIESNPPAATSPNHEHVHSQNFANGHAPYCYFLWTNKWVHFL